MPSSPSYPSFSSWKGLLVTAPASPGAIIYLGSDMENPAMASSMRRCLKIHTRHTRRRTKPSRAERPEVKRGSNVPYTMAMHRCGQRRPKEMRISFKQEFEVLRARSRQYLALSHGSDWGRLHDLIQWNLFGDLGVAHRTLRQYAGPRKKIGPLSRQRFTRPQSQHISADSFICDKRTLVRLWNSNHTEAIGRLHLNKTNPAAKCPQVLLYHLYSGDLF